MNTYIRKIRDFIRLHETVKSLILIAVIIGGALAVWEGIRIGLNAEYPLLVVSSGSMCPPTNCVLPIGALIVVRGEDPSTITVGKIIVFRPDPYLGDYLVVHRVYAVFSPTNNTNQYQGQYSFETHGDENAFACRCPAVDGWGQVPGSRLVGVYQFTIPIPYLGSAILSIRQFLYGDSCDLSQTCHLTSQGLLVIVVLVGSLFAFEIMEPSKKPSKASTEKAKSPEPLPGDTESPAPTD